MQTITKRIVEIKRQLDELESHVNSTLSILDCQRLPLNEYPVKWKDFVWNKYNSYVGHIPIYKTEEETLATLNKYKIEADAINAKNKPLMEKNKETFNKICNFLVKLGFSLTTYAHSGTGKRRHSYQIDTDWVAHLKQEYPMVDSNYDSFINWHRSQTIEIERFFRGEREKERLKQSEREERERKREEETERGEEQAKMINLAIEYLVSHGKVPCRDFNNDTAIDCAFKLKMELIEKPEMVKEAEIERPKTSSAIDRMELE